MSLWLYGDARTREVINASGPVVYLYGGFEGFDNFGDLLQLRSTIRFHRERSDWPVVIVVSLQAFMSPDANGDLYSAFDIDGVIWEDGELLDATDQHLDVLTDITSGGLLHIYGGGYLNRYWGDRRAFVCEQLVHRLHVAQYVLSGLQVDEQGVAYLRPLLESRRPLLIAARDSESRSLLQSVPGVGSVEFSFDDAVETVGDIGRALTRFGGIDSAAAGAVGLHMNLTPEYMSTDQAPAVLDAFSRVTQAHPDRGLVLLHAYNDRRRVVLDTVSSMDQLGLLSVSSYFEAVNLATLARTRDVGSGEWRAVVRSLRNISFVITASYHVALTMSMLGKPTFLVVANDYYRQKRAALGMADDIDVFLGDPTAFRRAFEHERRERVEWLRLLNESLTNAFLGMDHEAWPIVNPDSSEVAGTVSERYFLR